MSPKIVKWYLSCQAVPYWCILLTDTVLVLAAGLLGYAINHGATHTVSNLADVALDFCIFLPGYLVGFRMLHTYSGMIRQSSFGDLIRIPHALTIGMILALAMQGLLKDHTLLSNIQVSDLILQVLLATVMIVEMRVLAKMLYDVTYQNECKNGIYGLSGNSLLDLEMNNLLPREPINVDMDSISKKLKGKRIMVTGAAGSIGSELSWLLANFEPERLILVDQAETPLHDLRIRMKREWGSVKCATIVTNICHSHRMERIFQDYRPEIIFHAAAYKHVPMMEDNPVESILNNVDGTKKLADLAVKFGVKQFVMISTDKAVNPTSVMGCSKRICELYCQSLNQAGISDCQFVTTRFGNVLGSNGSVIPIFREQIRRGGPVMVTHPEINRFFMLIPEACRLVLQAATIGKGGQILVFDMGQPVRILDLAKRMIELSGQRNIQIEFSGLRPGEKLYEEVLNDQETVLPTSHPKIKVARVREVDYAEACRQIEELITMARSYDAEGTVRIMKNIIPEYQTIENNEKISSTVVADPVQPVRECTEKSENREERYGEFRYSSGDGATSASLQHC